MLRSARKTLIEAYEHRQLPLHQFLRGLSERDPARNPLFQVLFDHVRTSGNCLTVGDLELEAEWVPWAQTHFDLGFAIEEHGPASDNVQLRLVYYADIFSDETAAVLLRSYAKLVQQLSTEPDTPVSKFQLDESLPRTRAVVDRHCLRDTGSCVQLRRSAPSANAGILVPFAGTALDRGDHVRGSAMFHALLDPARDLTTNARGLNALLIRPEDVDPPGQSTHWDEVLGAIEALSTRSRAPLLVCLCPPSMNALQQRGAATLARLEAIAQAKLTALTNVRVLTSDAPGMHHGATSYDDAAGYEQARTPYAPLFYTSLATAIARTMAGVLLAPKKAIAVDCDNTLWGYLRRGWPARASGSPNRILRYSFFLRRKVEAGMLVCLCSKNNEADVDEVFRLRQEMILRLEDVAAKRVNWDAKSRNVASLAEELNLGVDSFVFLDDSPMECAEVEAHLPDVAVACLPANPDDVATFSRELLAL